MSDWSNRYYDSYNGISGSEREINEFSHHQKQNNLKPLKDMSFKELTDSLQENNSPTLEGIILSSMKTSYPEEFKEYKLENAEKFI